MVIFPFLPLLATRCEFGIFSAYEVEQNGVRQKEIRMVCKND